MTPPAPDTTPQGALAHWRRALLVYGDRRMVALLLLGFSSGLPLALTFGTLSVWLVQEGVDKTTIGLFALAGAPYTLKFLWSPLVDRMPLPLLTPLLGRRRAWGLLTQGGLLLAILALGQSHPGTNPEHTALLALLVAFLSASQDIVIDAYRVEILEESQYGAGAAVLVLGYRLGMLVSGAGALYLASYSDWGTTYAVMALLMTVGMVTLLLSGEPERVENGHTRALEERLRQRLSGRLGLSGGWQRLLNWFRGAVVGPFAEFLTRPAWLLILVFILLYKFGDALAGVMSNPFYLELGFTPIHIANISKLFGLFATIAGTLLGGVVVNRLGIMGALWLCGILQMASNLMFALLAVVGQSLPMLTLTIGLENLAGGMGTAAFVAYLSSLCNVAYTATQFALLSSLMAFGRTLFSSSGGWLAEQMDWVAFFILTTAAALPGLAMLWWMRRRFSV